MIWRRLLRLPSVTAHSTDHLIDPTWAKARVDAGDVTSIAWALSRGGRRQVGAAGTRTIDGDDPVDVDTIFRIYSLTKPVTAAATMLLVDDGFLDLDDPIEQWLPELADRTVVVDPLGPIDDVVPAQRAITVDDCLTFRLGWGMDFTTDEPIPVLAEMERLDLGLGMPNPSVAHEPDEWLRRLATVPLQCQPGEHWLYGTGCDVLGVLIARATGTPFDTFLAERIFEPLGMVDTGFSVPAADLDRFGPSHLREPGSERTVVDPVDGQWATPPAFPSGMHGLVSTVTDYLRFAEMLAGGGRHEGRQVLSAESVAAMLNDQLTVAQRIASGIDADGLVGWGRGCAVQAESTPERSAGTAFWHGARGCLWSFEPTSGLVAVCLTDEVMNGDLEVSVVDGFWRDVSG